MNKTVRTKRKDNRFFDALARGFKVEEAAKHAGYSKRVVYLYRKQHPDFDESWKEAKETYLEIMEAEADRRAMEGVEEPVFYQGKECGRIRKYSDVLLMFRLKSEAPDKYRERREVTGKDGGPLQVTQVQLVALDGNGANSDT